MQYNHNPHVDAEKSSAPTCFSPELSLVIPTYNERGNISLLISKLTTALEGLEWEAIFVDDHSLDGTAAHILEIARMNRRVRVLERVGRHGLSSACIEGALHTSGPYVAVMDADLQHDESILPRMLELLKSNGLDIVIGSRRVPGGSMGNLSHARVVLSNIGSRISRAACRCHVSDTMSGFFIFRRPFFEEVLPRLSGRGFKLLVDMLASSTRAVRVGEVAYQFRSRQWGRSKLNLLVDIDHLRLLAGKLIQAKW
jgi:dolichol-phosphate mannosyltransferase